MKIEKNEQDRGREIVPDLFLCMDIKLTDTLWGYIISPSNPRASDKKRFDWYGWLLNY